MSKQNVIFATKVTNSLDAAKFCRKKIAVGYGYGTLCLHLRHMLHLGYKRGISKLDDCFHCGWKMTNFAARIINS